MDLFFSLQLPAPFFFCKLYRDSTSCHCNFSRVLFIYSSYNVTRYIQAQCWWHFWPSNFLRLASDFVIKLLCILFIRQNRLVGPNFHPVFKWSFSSVQVKKPCLKIPNDPNQHLEGMNMCFQQLSTTIYNNHPLKNYFKNKITL